ncbi:CoA pyrophosphatase [Wenxinia saemankumensis]|nr:CoA pyrophosphatase [Wenxinia saemankumensis]
MTRPEVARDLDLLRRALDRPGEATSDFDLNPDLPLPAGHALRPAGVLAAFTPGPAGLELILTRRSAALRHHPGQIAFPGGKQDPGDATVIDAALREAEEEVGLPRGAARILGTLPPHRTVTGFHVTPVVGWVPAPFAELAEPDEVDEIFRVPFAFVTDPANFRVEARSWNGTRRHYYVAPRGPWYIWGATARMLRGLAERVASCR